MDRSILVGKIAGFLFVYNALDVASITEKELEFLIKDKLETASFVEILINTIIIRAKKHKGIDIELVKELLLELEKIRLDLEYENM